MFVWLCWITELTNPKTECTSRRRHTATNSLSNIYTSVLPLCFNVLNKTLPTQCFKLGWRSKAVLWLSVWCHNTKSIITSLTVNVNDRVCARLKWIRMNILFLSSTTAKRQGEPTMAATNVENSSEAQWIRSHSDVFLWEKFIYSDYTLSWHDTYRMYVPPLTCVKSDGDDLKYCYSFFDSVFIFCYSQLIQWLLKKEKNGIFQEVYLCFAPHFRVSTLQVFVSSWHMLHSFLSLMLNLLVWVQIDHF